LDRNKQTFFNGLFALLILVLLFPVISLSYIVTHDGPAHIYNSGLIIRIIQGDQDVLSFMTLKPFPDPNWIGHFLLAILQLIFSPNVAERILQGLYIISLPVAFKWMLHKTSRNNEWMALLALPFVLTNFFFLGVYNFILSVAFLFMALAYLFPVWNRRSPRKYFGLFFFSLLLYFSHLLSLGVFLMMIFIGELYAMFRNRPVTVRSILHHSWPTILSLLPVVVLLSLCYLEKLQSGPAPVVSFSQHLSFLFYIAPLLTLKHDPEIIYAVSIFFLVISLLGIALFYSLRSRTKEMRGSEFYRLPSFWAIATLLMLMLFFVMPDSAATGGVIKFRFELFFYLFLLVFVSTLSMPAFAKWIVPLVIVPWIVFRTLYLYPMLKTLSDDAAQIVRLPENASPGSLILPLNYSLNWMHDNLSNYMGTKNDFIILDNYEASTPHFPIRWNEGMDPNQLLGNFNGFKPLCADVHKYEKVTGRRIDYITVWHYQELGDSCSQEIRNLLQADFVLVHETENGKLFARKNAD